MSNGLFASCLQVVIAWSCPKQSLNIPWCFEFHIPGESHIFRETRDIKTHLCIVQFQPRKWSKTLPFQLEVCGVCFHLSEKSQKYQLSPQFISVSPRFTRENNCNLCPSATPHELMELHWWLKLWLADPGNKKSAAKRPKNKKQPKICSETHILKTRIKKRWSRQAHFEAHGDFALAESWGKLGHPWSISRFDGLQVLSLVATVVTLWCSGLLYLHVQAANSVANEQKFQCLDELPKADDSLKGFWGTLPSVRAQGHPVVQNWAFRTEPQKVGFVFRVQKN